MFRIILRWAFIAIVLSPTTVFAAAPVKLKLSFYSSDRSLTYKAVVEQFVNAVNAEGKGVVEIEVYFSGALSKSQKEQPQLVLDGKADIAFVVPGQNPERFADNSVMELPGLFRNAREGTQVYSQLVDANLLAGYSDFHVIGVVTTAPEPIHSRQPIASLANLAGQKIRANNPTAARTLAKLGVTPAVIAFNETAPAISSGTIDGAVISAAYLFDVGIGRLVTNHYLLGISANSFALLMNRQVFDGLPADAQAIIRKYSGEWFNAHYIEVFEKLNKDGLEQITAAAGRVVVSPSEADLKSADAAFASVRKDWAASPRDHDLLMQAEARISKLREAR
jgi:TRAP-type C4-dicarboxylate transport system substrate-binding protein